MKKSALFNAVIDRCKSGKTEDDVTINAVVSATLRLINEVESGSTPSVTLTAADKRELADIQRSLERYKISYVKAADGIDKYSAEEDDKFIGHLQYFNMIVLLQAAESDDFGEISLKKFIAKVLENPPAAVKQYVVGDVPPVSETEQEEAATDASDVKLSEEEQSSAAALEEQRRKLEKLLGRLNGGSSQGSDGKIGGSSDDRGVFDKELEELLSEHESEEKQTEKPTVAQIAAKTKEVQDFLSSTVFGQDVAVNAFASGYFQAELSAITDESRVRPRATFLFAGPPGVGKTFLCEQAAKALGLPFMRFDMSEYSDKEANIEFCGSDKVYKNGKEGNVTSFVAEHPHSILLFDEIEKAHLNVIHLFLQILDAGRLRDNYTDEEVSFRDTIIVLTTNAGKGMYEDDSVNLATVTRKAILKALSADINPVTNAPMFPSAICSRFAYGNVVMFNRMGANYLLKIAERELKGQIDGIKNGTGIEITYDPLLPYAIIYAEGGVADARTVKGKSGAYVFNELYELFRLMQSDKNGYDVGAIKKIYISVDLPDDPKIVSLFKNESKPNVLLFADAATGKKFAKSVTCANVLVADSKASAMNILEREEISLIVCDIACGADKDGRDVLNIEDMRSDGREFLLYAVERSRVSVYVLQKKEGDVSREEFTSLAGMGAEGLITLNGAAKLNAEVEHACEVAYQQNNLTALGRANKVLTHKTLQRVSPDGAEVEIALFDFRLTTALDVGDSSSVVDGVSKPNVGFDDVIGAKDAKEELNYFIEYLKNPVKFIKRGVRAPKGILLYGPPGTGKTLLAKAMAGESDVTFIRAEGNQFLKKYVGEGADSVHKLFATARRYAPSILFIDEIDAIARQRGEAANSDDVLTSFLTEMDGFNTDNDRPVFVLAATNYEVTPGTPRSLDAALLRRFDRKIYVELPTRDERVQFLRQKLAKAEGNTVTEGEIENIASRSTGTSLADLDSVFELALRNVIKSSDLTLTDKILEDAFETFNSGSAKKWKKDDLLRTARHEAGHAITCYAGGETPSYLTIVARGSHGGYMQHADEEDKGIYTKKELLSRVRTALGGRAAEVVYYGDEDGVSTGASGDLRTATAIIESMICNYGMDESIGLGSVDLQRVAASPHYEHVVARINEVLAREFTFVKEYIAANRETIDALVDALMEKNSLKSVEIECILNKNKK